MNEAKGGYMLHLSLFPVVYSIKALGEKEDGSNIPHEKEDELPLNFITISILVP